MLARHAHRRMALRHHPDRGGDAARMGRVNRAWEVIGDAGRRAAYDRAAEAGAGRVPGAG